METARPPVALIERTRDPAGSVGDHNLGKPAALCLVKLIERAQSLHMHDFAAELGDRKNRRTLPHKLERVDYVPVRNPDADDGLFKLQGKRQAIYAQRALTLADQVRAARMLT